MSRIYGTHSFGFLQGDSSIEAKMTIEFFEYLVCMILLIACVVSLLTALLAGDLATSIITSIVGGLLIAWLMN
jgi:uncharacterized membrane protein (DUF485 family)